MHFGRTEDGPGIAIEQARKQATERSRARQQQWKHKNDSQAKPQQYRFGDQIRYWLPETHPDRVKKFAPRWWGPCVIIEKLGEDTFLIEQHDVSTGQMIRRFHSHSSRLLPYHSPSHHSSETVETELLDVLEPKIFHTTSDGQNVLEPENFAITSDAYVLELCQVMVSRRHEQQMTERVEPLEAVQPNHSPQQQQQDRQTMLTRRSARLQRELDASFAAEEDENWRQQQFAIRAEVERQRREAEREAEALRRWREKTVPIGVKS